MSSGHFTAAVGLADDRLAELEHTAEERQSSIDDATQQMLAARDTRIKRLEDAVRWGAEVSWDEAPGATKLLDMAGLK